MKCSGCRRNVFTDLEILNHEPGKGQTLFQYRKQNEQQTITCNHIFLDFVPETDELEGKIHCPFCHLKLGSFDLKGSQCSCGKWISPSFALLKSKIDML